MIDLRGQNNIKHSWGINVDTNILTLSFLADGEESLGDIVIESNKSKSILNALNEVARTLFPDIDSIMYEGYLGEFSALNRFGDIVFNEFIISTPPPGAPPAPIDLKGQVGIAHTWVPDGDDIVIQFRDSVEVLIGEMVIEGFKVRSLFHGLLHVRARAFGEDDPTQFKPRTLFDKNIGVAGTNYAGLEF